MKQILSMRRIARSLVTILSLGFIQVVVAPVVAPQITAPKAEAVQIDYASYTSGYDVVVPAGVYAVSFTARGGAGGKGGDDGTTLGIVGTNVGYVTATYNVSPGDRITIYPGGAGTNGTSSVQNTGGGAGGAQSIPINTNLTPSLKFNGTVYTNAFMTGGTGGNAGSSGTSGGGGGGGAGTIIAVNDNAIIVAAGGGGGGGSGNTASNVPIAWNGTYVAASGSAGGTGTNGNTCGVTDGGGGGGGGGGWQGGAGGAAPKASTECVGTSGSPGANWYSNNAASVSSSYTTANGAGSVTYTFSYYSVNACNTDVQTYDIYTIVKVTTTLNCTWTVPATVSVVDLFLVGGGAGGAGDGGPGGGGGNALSRTAVPVTPNSTMNLKVGYGGAGGNWAFTSNAYSGDSTTVVTSTGTVYYALGGNGSANGPAASVAAAASVQNGGFAGGLGGTAPGNNYGTAGGQGKTGFSNYFYGTQNTYGGGGGGGAFTQQTTCTNVLWALGSNGGGAGASVSSGVVYPGNNGTDGTGGGGGGGTAVGCGTRLAGGKGGSGVILIRYATSAANAFPSSLTGALSGRWTPNELQVLDSSRSGWIDASGTYASATVSGAPTISNQGTTDGAYATGTSKTNLVAAGGTTAKATLIAGALSNYTIFHIARYPRSGSTFGRAIAASGSNYVTGLYSTSSDGVAHHNNGWITPNGVAATTTQYKWLLSTDMAKMYRANGKDVTYQSDNGYVSGSSGPTGFGVNNYSTEPSDWQMLDILVFNRQLTNGEIRTMESYLSRIYGLTLDTEYTTSDTDTATTMGSGNNYFYSNIGVGNTFNDTFTVEAWIKPTSSCDSTICQVYVKESTILFGIQNGVLYWALYGKAIGWEWRSTGVKVQSGEWHHITMVKTLTGSQNGSLLFYLDGQLAYTVSNSPYTAADATNSSSTSSYGLSDADNNWLLIGTRSNVTQTFTGDIDELKVWNVARTASQVASDMTSNDGSSPNLQMYFNFNKNMSSQATPSTPVVANLAAGGVARTDLYTYYTATYPSVAVTSTIGPYSAITFPRTIITANGGWKVTTPVSRVNSLVVGGGGGGGAAYNAYGGGAGGAGGGAAVIDTITTLASGAIEPIVIGVGGIGGAGGTTSGSSGQSGTQTTFKTFTAAPGTSGALGNSSSGASHYTQAGVSGTSGNGNLPGDRNWDASGGGGGAGGAGSPGHDISSTGGCGGPGGSGVASSISGAQVFYGAGGGGGGSYAFTNTAGDTPNGCDGTGGYGIGGTGGLGGSNSAGGNGALLTYTVSGSTYTSSSAVAASNGNTYGSGGGGGGYTNGLASVAGGSGKQGVVIVRWITALVPSYTKPVNTTLDVGQTETFTTLVSADSATVGLTRTFTWESTTAGANGTFTRIKQGTGAANAAFSWVPTDTSTSGSNYLYRLIVTDSDTAGLFITDSSTAYATINPAMVITSTATSTTLNKTINVTRSETYTITLGTSTYRPVLSPVIPGITLDTSTAGSAVLKIADTATVGTYLETLTVTDSVSASISIPLTIVVQAPASLTAGGEIVKNGQVLNLDAGNSRSILLGDGASTSGATWNDISGSKFNASTGGTQNSYTCNAPTYSRDYGGIINFTSASQQCFATPYINANFNKSYTIEAWIKTNGSFGTSAGILAQSFLSGNVAMAIGDIGGTGQIYVGFYDGGYWRYPATGFTPTSNTWYHIVGTYDGANMYTYVNGNVVSNVAYTGGFGGTANSLGFNIGKRWDGTTSGYYFNGAIGEVRAYNRALTSTEVTQNYNATNYRYQTGNQTLLKPAQKYGQLSLETYTVTSGGDTKTVTFAVGNRTGITWDTSTAGTVKLAVQESLTPGTYYDTITVTDNYAVSTVLPITFTIGKADTITVSMDTGTVMTYNALPATVYPKPVIKGLVLSDSLTVTTNFSSALYTLSSTVPTNADTYTVIGSNAVFSVGLSSYYQNIVYETSTLVINKAKQRALDINLYGGVVGSPWQILLAGGSGTGAVTETLTGFSTISGCAISNHILTATGTTQGYCEVRVVKAGDQNYFAETSTAQMYFLAFIRNEPINQSGSGSSIGINSDTALAIETGTAPSITSLSGTSFSIGQTVTIYGSGFSYGPITVKFWRNKISASVAVTSDTQLSAVIPSGTTAGVITLVNGYGTAFSASSITILP